MLVSTPGSETAFWLASDGRRRVHAAMIPTRAQAERIAWEITEDDQQPGVTARAAQFGEVIAGPGCGAGTPVTGWARPSPAAAPQ